ncbi:hypothetical protein [Fimbriiglobus ruber]|uniref:Uncharacterized protein n=1 Tax=Fimbriiglobus ruber TaxID=1908690 RepID=A0A225E6U1_9BACT|nr:hypothetical protein [Fimbriiglobus ruber]OWK45826.1 hypothetical protein FRUB_02157 [Fimbriiglobus ruber]
MGRAKGIHLIKGKEPLLKQIICAVEYDTGELYFDRMGRISRTLAERETGWWRNGNVGLAATTLLNPEEELRLDVSSSRTVITSDLRTQPRVIEAEDVTRFAAEAQAAISIVTDELEIESFQRVGYRELYHFESESVEESERWVQSLGLMTASDALYKKFGPQHYAMNWSLVLIGDECRYRLSLSGTERVASIPVGDAEVNFRESGAKHLKRDDLLRTLKLDRARAVTPEVYSLLDVDAFLWDQIDTDFRIGDFITARATSMLKLLRECIAG